MERRVRWKSHARCEVGEKPEMISGAYLSLYTWTEKLSSNEDLHESFTKAVEDGLDFLKDADTGDSDDSHLNTRIWVDETGRIAGRKIEFQEGDK